jgi:hypothetical protein
VIALRIYNEESDRHVHISFKDALAATCYGHPAGPVGDMFHLADLSENNQKIFVNHWNKVKKGKDGAAKLKAVIDAATDLSDYSGMTNDEYSTRCSTILEWIVDCVDSGIWCPVEIVIARPFIEHLTLSSIITVAGRDTGATLFGPADMQVSLYAPFFVPLFLMFHPSGVLTVVVFDVRFRRTLRSRQLKDTTRTSSAPLHACTLSFCLNV